MKELEERGIGRPSTYAAIISTIVDRGYVQKTAGRGGKFLPTEIGFVVTELLVENLKDIFDFEFTARMEEDLDQVEEGKIKWTDALHEFYGKFVPTEIGLVVTDLLVENFKDIFDFQYTARLEEELDEIEEGKQKMCIRDRVPIRRRIKVSIGSRWL